MRTPIRILVCLAVAAAVVAGVLKMQHTADNEVHPHHDQLVNADGSWKYTNALEGQTSPYLLQHAHNPVDWRPWGEAAFAEARREQKPIFLSIGYSTCYWCHVMERLVFENPAIAEKMNAGFVNIKVDREERPDVDDIYMTATQLYTQRGGWPMSVFLTPPAPEEGAEQADGYGLKPFFCGTYFPPEPAHGMPSFPQVLDAMRGEWENNREAVLNRADKLAESVEQVLNEASAPGPVGVASVQAAANDLLRSYDAEHGGFGGAVGRPKFPQPDNLMFLMAIDRDTPETPIDEPIRHTLDRMARGGMYDQVGGGFHRYSTDEKWLVPHFEKMLYDNGQLLSLYAAALEALPPVPARDGIGKAAGQYERVLRETADYVLREMTDESGAFWSAQDAEVNAREGQNYVWTAEQIDAAIVDEELAAFAKRMYGLDRGANFTDPHAPDATPVNVLYLPEPLDTLGEDAGAKRERVNALLKAVRDERDQPGTDDKVLTAWNGLMIAGLADAGRVLNEPRYVEAAARAADAIMDRMATDDGGLFRSMRAGEAKIPAFLEDYASFITGLLALNEADAFLSPLSEEGGDKAYLAAARRYADHVFDRFEAPGGGYYDTLADQADLFVRTRGTYDGATPSGNSVMIHNLLDLHVATGERHYFDRATTDLRSFAEPLTSRSTAMTNMQHALLRALRRSAEAANALAAPAVEGASVSDALTEPLTVDVKQTGEGRYDLILTVAEGYHINSHTPGAENLIATSIEPASPDAFGIEVAWPKAQEANCAYADQPLSVYEGTVTISITVTPSSSDDGERSLMMRYQACTESACLAPRVLTIELP